MKNDIPESRFKNQSALVSDSVLRQPIYIIGLGSIGSFVALTLAKMGFIDLTGQDMDKVEDHNIPTQFFPAQSVGEYKALALADMVYSMSGTFISNSIDAWTPETRYPVGTQALIVAVDDMDLRMAIWKAWGKKVPIYIEARMGAQVARVYTINTSDEAECAFYESTLYPQSEAAPDRCAMKSIIYTVLGCAALITSQVKKALSIERYPTEIIYDFVSQTQTSYKAKAEDKAANLVTAGV